MDRNEIRKHIEKIDEKNPPKIPKFSVDFMDRNVNPADDFYSYACGKWDEINQIPDDKMEWGASSELVEYNRYVLGKILEKCAFGDDWDEKSDERKLGDFYLSAMDTDRIEEIKTKPLEPIMDLIRDVKEKNDLMDLTGKLHLIGIEPMFSYESYGDMKKSNTYAFYIVQGGLSLPSSEYYIQDSFKNLRQQFKEHIKKMFIIVGENEENSENMADIVFNIETKLAESSFKPVELRDPERNYNRFMIKELRKEFPGIEFERYLKEIDLKNTDYVIIGQPKFFHNLEEMLKNIPIEEWKIYFRWHLLKSTATFLHKEMQDEHFDFFQRKVYGQKSPEPRWKRTVRLIDGTMGEALGKIYVRDHFDSRYREKISEMVEDIKDVFRERLQNVDWMSEETRKKALEKFSRFRAKIGYPSKFIDYSSLRISPDDFLGNVLRSNSFESDRMIKRIGMPVDKELWEMTPPTVNAYFSPTDNEIVFPAGILQPPFFDPDLDDAVNYGATGGTIAHEITHGFDDEGRRFDAEGNLKEWWTKEDEAEFTRRASEVSKLYSAQEVLPGLFVNGDLTLGENIADLGGVSIAYEALQRKLNRNPEMKRKIDGFTPEQRFFIGWAQSWREKDREEFLRWLVSSNPHAPSRIRASVPAVTHEDFEKVFGLQGTNSSSMKKIKVW
ncbi:M13 family metallopeptidase [Cuniculiplasma sp. SKW3]|uniref:M13 family metallopeptidase n=1 Tax=Cuniculiplasma sp. SKW3 TaxID=3400170 RepID=UPI003FD54A48